MYFEIENTPEHIRRARRAEPIRKASPKQCPRLILAPFSRPPQVIFEDVTIGTSCERILEVLNPTKKTQQLSLCGSLPAGLVVHLPEDCLLVEPNVLYHVILVWTPVQPTALRDTIQFSNENRGRYEVIVVRKTGLGGKRKGNQCKAYKVSPGKIQKKSAKKSPVAITVKQAEVLYNSTKVKQCVNNVEYTYNRRENVLSENYYNMASRTYNDRCPFDSPNSVDLKFDTSEIFSNMRQMKLKETMQHTYDKYQPDQTQSILVPSKKQSCNLSNSNVFDNLTFTPLKNNASKTDKLENGPKIILSMSNNSDLDDSLNMKGSNKENEPHSIMSITSTQPPNKWLSINHHTQLDRDCVETPILQNKKIPNTSSPKELNSPNFSINTDFSRISDLSFLPPRFSTERKILPKIDNDTHDLIDEAMVKLNSNTFTKDSPNTPVDFQMYTLESKPPQYFMREQHPKMCRQSLFRDFYQQRDLREEQFSFPHEKSPTRSTTPPPLQSIPEESSQYSDSQSFNRTGKQTTTFTINRTFDKENNDRASISRSTWSKRSVRAEPELWKMPTSLPKKSLKAKHSLHGKESLDRKPSDATFEAENSLHQNTFNVNHISTVYSQSFTVDPFQSATYFYDDEAVKNFEKEFKRWLNCILTPPAELESNIEVKVDVGKAWLENRNKEVPLAPTKEQVCSAYHNSGRLESLRRAARTLLKTPEIIQVFQKLNAQIEKKLIAIRTDRNLHLDVGLQKVVLEMILSYNPLWLRIGLEAIYGTILPLKSNSDVEGLTKFIIQRMFKNPYLNKHTKNIRSPAYMDAIKKFTLKKFFILVFFLDQAKQKKLIPHDPCLFCRNALCKESREVVIRFTSELIAGIGDITKHLRPMGYVVSHKQSYLDEYKYAVHNIATDLRDGVRLTKVMEIILMKNNLLQQLRTPAISRLQKIHNVHVALNALKEANFTIAGEINSHDVADGHREKTLSLLWQLIHVFRAPLFEKAAGIIQLWWKKKYVVIVEKRKEEERIRQKLSNNATIIQRWWRRIQLNRLLEWQRQQLVSATIMIQKCYRGWKCRKQLQKMKTSVNIIQEWYISMKLIKEAKQSLQQLKKDKEILLNKSATVIQSHIRRWLSVRRFRVTLIKIIFIQSLVRKHIVRKEFELLKKYTVLVQRRYRSKLLMRVEMNSFAKKRDLVIVLQKTFRMIKEYRAYNKLKKATITIQNHYRAITKMRQDKTNYETLKKSALLLQSLYRCRKARKEYLRQINLITVLQIRIKAYLLMKTERYNFLTLKTATIIIQRRIKSYLVMKKERSNYLLKRNAAIIIQNYYRSYIIGKLHRKNYEHIRKSVITLQKHYRCYRLMKVDKDVYQKKKEAAICIQRKYRALILSRQCTKEYKSIRTAIITIQRRFRALLQMKKGRQQYLELRNACVNIQKRYKAMIAGRQQRKLYLEKREVVTKIQYWYRNCRRGEQTKKIYEQTKKACIIIQTSYRAYMLGRKQRNEYIKIKTATICIQTYYRSYVKMKIVRQQYVNLRTATVTIQKFYKSYLLTQHLRKNYLKIKASVQMVENYYIRRKDSRKIRYEYCRLREATKFVQIKYRSICLGRRDRQSFLALKDAVIKVQHRFRALLAMRKQRDVYRQLLSSVVLVQRHFRAQSLMKTEALKYQLTLKSCKIIQRYYRAYKARKTQREKYLNLKSACINLQNRYRSLLKMRRERSRFLEVRRATLILQCRYRAHCLMLRERTNYVKISKACLTIQRFYIAYSEGSKQRNKYLELRCATVTIQRFYRLHKLSVLLRQQYINTRKSIIKVQTYVRRYIARKNFLRLRKAVLLIQAAYRLEKQKDLLKAKKIAAALCIQKNVRRYLVESRYKKYRKSVISIQQIWKGKLVARMMRCGYLQKRNFIIKLQSIIRGYLVRMKILVHKENINRIKTEKRNNWAASKIQALFRGHKTRVNLKEDRRFSDLRRRWREGALKSTQESLKERNAEAMEVLRNMSDIEMVIRAFRSLELLTEVFPMMYHDNAASIVRRVYIYMSVTNRSISSIEVLKSAASVLVNLTRYKITGPKIYDRDRISPILKFMWRFSNSETHLFCILSTYIWLFSKYEEVRKDLTAFLRLPENHKMLTTIKGNVGRMQRMTSNANKHKFHTPQTSKFVSHTSSSQSLNQSLVHNIGKANGNSFTLPALEPDYGIVRADKPRYFEDAEQAITCLFRTYQL